MTKSEVILAVLAAAEGRPYTPVQIQKAVFLVDRNLPGIITDEDGFGFAPYDYGPFSSAVYSEAENLKSAGSAVIAPSGTGRWRTYAASDLGMQQGNQALNRLSQAHKEYVLRVSEWVRSLPFDALVKSIYNAYPEMRANSIFRG